MHSRVNACSAHLCQGSFEHIQATMLKVDITDPDYKSKTSADRVKYQLSMLQKVAASRQSPGIAPTLNVTSAPYSTEPENDFGTSHCYTFRSSDSAAGANNCCKATILRDRLYPTISSALVPPIRCKREHETFKNKYLSLLKQM